jgi:hypothetical protein
MPFITLHLKAEVVVMTQKLTPTEWALRFSEGGITKQYLDLQELREEVRRAEISFGSRMHTQRAPRDLSGVRIDARPPVPSHLSLFDCDHDGRLGVAYFRWS